MKKLNNTLDEYAKQNGYFDRTDLLRDYGMMPSVQVPNHKKTELLQLLIANKKDEKSRKK